MKKILSLFVLISLSLSLISCGNNDDGIPEGMQLVRGGEEYGFYMYAPEEWTVSNQGNISAAYASGVDTTSVTYTEISTPDVSVAQYFNDSISDYPESMGFKLVTQNPNGEAVTFGNAETALKFEYDFEYSEHKFRAMQIFAEYDGRFGIFTFTSFRENMSSSDTVQYDYYSEKLNGIITNFKYVKIDGEPSAPSYETKDGYKLVSNKDVAKFSLYVPESFEVEYSSGIALASLPDGSSVNLSRATSTGISVDQYWKSRKDELTGFFGEVTTVTDAEGEHINRPAALGNCKQAFSYEYTYSYGGETYHVYQIFAVKGFNGFAFTYTAKEENYAKHFDTILKIAEKVEF